MKGIHSTKLLRWATWSACSVSIAWLLAGCKGLPLASEKQARQDFQGVGQFYRPEDHVPNLPKLDAEDGLGTYLRYAVLNHPQVESAYYDWAAAVERISVERSFPDPRLTFQMDIQDVITSLMPGLMIDLPGPGKRHAAAGVASAESEVKYFAFENSALQVAFNLKQAYYRLHLLNAKLDVNVRTLALLEELEKLARTQNETGKGTLQDVLRAQIEQDRLTTEIENLKDSKGFLMAQFKSALGMKVESPEPPFPAKFETTSPIMTNLLATALRRNPRLKGMEAEVRQAEAAITVARKGRIPDFSIGLEADVKMSPTLYRPQGSATLPIWRDKLAAQIAEAQASKRSAQARLSAEQILLPVDFAEKSFMARENDRNLELLQKRLLPKAEQALEVSRSAYLSGQTDFLNVIDAERTLLSFQLMETEARAGREIALAELSLVIAGVPPESVSIQKTQLMR